MGYDADTRVRVLFVARQVRLAAVTVFEQYYRTFELYPYQYVNMIFYR